VLDHRDFQNNIPAFYNQSETFSNVQLIKATIHINQMKWASLKQVREAICAWTVISNDIGALTLPIDPKILNQALMLVNRVMSEVIMMKWL
jgi:hypothetical protein